MCSDPETLCAGPWRGPNSPMRKVSPEPRPLQELGVAGAAGPEGAAEEGSAMVATVPSDCKSQMPPLQSHHLTEKALGLPAPASRGQWDCI